MFAVIAPALMTGAFADRVNFGPYMVFIVALGALGVFSSLPLDLGRRMDGETRRLGFRGWDCHPRDRGIFRAGDGCRVAVETPLGRER